MLSLNELSRDLTSGEMKSRTLVDQCIAQIEDTSGQGNRAFLTVYKQQAIDEADLVDLTRSKGLPISPWAGIPLSIKDLFDCVGEVTTAGSRVLDDSSPATKDAVIVAALRQAGFVLLGKCNMTEFAYSGLGINSHFGTPLSPWDRETGRIPGGSSSGGAVSVSDSMAAATIGTDTGGSCRIPAAFCGITGFKPTSHRVSREGVIPLSTSMDSVGPLANTVSCCAVLDSVLSGGSGINLESFPPSGLHLGVLEGYLVEHLDTQVSVAYSAALTRLSEAGVKLTTISIEELAELPGINRKGGLVGAEAHAWHRKFMETRSGFYDQWVRARLDFASAQSAADYIDLLNHRERMISTVKEKTHWFDALVMPAVQIVPPTLASMQDNEKSNSVNQLSLRNTAVANFLNRPAITLPCHQAGTAPTGLMLMGETDCDRRLLSIAQGMEARVRDA